MISKRLVAILLLASVQLRLSILIVPSEFCSQKCFNSSQACQCETPFVYPCGEGKCARSLAACGEYNLAERYLQSHLFSTQVQMTQLGNEIESRMRRYMQLHRLLKTHIKACPTTAFNGEVCRRRTKCLEERLSKVIKLNIKHTYKYFIQTSMCPCNGKRRFTCEFNYCTVSENACQAFKIMNKNSHSSFQKKCPFLSV